MASSDNYLMTMIEQPWSFRTTFADPWTTTTSTSVSDMMIFSNKLETETIAKALHTTISNSPPSSSQISDGVNNNNNNSSLLPFDHAITYDSSGNGLSVFPAMPTGSADSDGHVSMPPQRNGKKKNAVVCPTGRVTKRKSRASKRQATTFITADPANFREMVQQVTGVRFGVGGLSATDVAQLLVRPEPQRAGGLQVSSSAFDGSGILLGGSGSLVQPRQQQIGSAGVDFDSFCSFPTLESSKVHQF